MLGIKSIIDEMKEAQIAEQQYIRVVNGRWTLDKKTFPEMTLGEHSRIAEHIGDHNEFNEEPKCRRIRINHPLDPVEYSCDCNEAQNNEPCKFKK